MQRPSPILTPTHKPARRRARVSPAMPPYPGGRTRGTSTPRHATPRARPRTSGAPPLTLNSPAPSYLLLLSPPPPRPYTSHTSSLLPPTPTPSTPPGHRRPRPRGTPALRGHGTLPSPSLGSPPRFAVARARAPQTAMQRRASMPAAHTTQPAQPMMHARGQTPSAHQGRAMQRKRGREQAGACVWKGRGKERRAHPHL